MSKFISALLGVSVLAVAATAQAEGRVMSNDLSQCRNGPSTLVQISGVKASTGKIRVHSYRRTAADRLATGRCLARLDVPARAGTLNVCVPLPQAAAYGNPVRDPD